jgi:hypothetical protein
VPFALEPAAIRLNLYFCPPPYGPLTTAELRQHPTIVNTGSHRAEGSHLPEPLPALHRCPLSFWFDSQPLRKSPGAEIMKRCALAVLNTVVKSVVVSQRVIDPNLIIGSTLRQRQLTHREVQ